MTRGQDGADVKSMVDLMLVKKERLLYVRDVMAGGEWDEASQTTTLYCVKSG